MSSPARLEVQVHCRRVAAVANLIAHHLFLPAGEKALLHAACLLHHHSIGLFAPKSAKRLLADVLEADAPGRVVAAPAPDQVGEVLSAYRIPGSGSAAAEKLAGILRLAEEFDLSMEAQPVGGEGIPEIFERLGEGVEAGLWPDAALQALGKSTRPLSIGQPDVWRVPVFPQAAQRMLSLMRNPRASTAQVVQAACLDPGTAGLLMQLANSVLFGARAPIATLSAAIARLGFATARKVIVTAAMRPVFGSAKLEEAWPHSVQVADLSEQLAARAADGDPEEAFLAGLLHDVGRIALLALPLYDSVRLRGLEHEGCPALYAENLLLQVDHATLGARIATGWHLPEAMVEAIRWHHQPEKSQQRLAALLYLAEFLSGSEEDLPSVVRLTGALKSMGLAWEDVGGFTVSHVGQWLAAA